MIPAFWHLKETYASREISLDELKAIESSGIVSFTNSGISRSNKDCLLCIIRFDALDHLITEVISRTFPDAEAFRRCIEASSLELFERGEEGSLIFSDSDDRVEIIAFLEEDGSVRVDIEDVEGESAFQVFLRVQH